MRKLICLFVMVALVGLFGCKINLNTVALNENVDADSLVKKFTEHEELEYKKWRKVDIYATMLHKSMASFRNDLPPAGKTRVVFRLQGLEQMFDITQLVATVHTGKSQVWTISGLGTDNMLINGKKSDLIEYVELEKTGGEHNDKLNKFSLTFPFEMTNDTDYLNIDFTDTRVAGKSFGFKWDFGE